MYKTKRIKSIILTLFIFLIGISNVSADTVIIPIDYITNNTSLYISNNQGADIQLQPTIENNNNINIKNISLSINYSFKGNVIYQIELSTPTQNLTNVNKIDILSGDNACNFNGLSDNSIGYPKIRFNCPYDTNNIVIGLSNSSGNNITSSYNFRWNYNLLSIVNENVVNFDPVIDGQNQIKDDINNSIQNSTDTIINNQNQNNEELKDTINDNFNSCRDSVNLFNYDNVTIEKGSIGSDGLFVSSSSRIRIYNIKLLNNTKYTISSSNNNLSVVPYFYDSNGNFISYDSGWKNMPYTFTMPSNAIILKLLFKNNVTDDISITDISNLQIQEGLVATKYEEYGQEICSNKIDETNDKLDNIGGALTDSSPTDMSGLGDSAGWLPAGPVDSILTLPLTMLNNLVTNLSNQCQTISIRIPFVNTNLTLPCIKSLYDKIGITGTLFQSAGLIASAFILFNYLLSLYKWVDDTLTMRENTLPGYFDDNWGGGA